MKALVVVLTSNHTHYAMRAYESIKNQHQVDFEYDVIININTINQDYPNKLREAFKNIDIELVQTESNGRPGKGHNSVLELFRERTGYDFLIMLDGDDMFYPCAFRQIQQLLQKNPETDIAHLMINDNINTHDQEKNRIKLNGNYYLYTAANLQENWWDTIELKDPFNEPLYKCRTPSRLLLASRKFFDSRVQIKYSERCRLYDDFLAFLTWSQASYEKCLNVYSLSDSMIYCYNGQNDDSVTYQFSKNNHDEEQRVFNQEIGDLNAMRDNWDEKLRNLPWIKLDPPEDFTMKDKIKFANKEFVEFEIQHAVRLGKEYQLAGDFSKAKRMYQNAERGGIHNQQVKVNLAVCYHHLHLHEQAANSYEESLRIENTFIAHRNLTMIYFQLKKYKLVERHLTEAEKFPEALKHEFKQQFKSYRQELTRITKMSIISKPIHKKLGNPKPVLCIYTGYSPGFNGKNYQDRNVWGSEIAAVHLAELFADRYQVCVFCICDEELSHNGVNYYHFTKFESFQNQIQINILLVSRFMHFFMAFRTNAEKVFYWAHDARIHDAFQGKQLENQGSYLFHNMLDKIDGIICVSNWHKDYFMKWAKIPNYARHKVHVIRNGIDISYFDNSQPKIENRMIWASNPDRGLDVLLKCYPKIREQVPDVTLDIYYSNLKGENMPNERYKFIVEQVEALPGVKFHGKIPEQQLCQEYCKADLFPYFNRSHETYCISALQACAGGCIVVCRNFSGLKDSVGPVGYLLNGNVDDEKWQEKAILNIVNIFKDKEHKAKIQAAARDWGKHNQWKDRTDKWFNLFNPMNSRVETITINDS